MKYLHKLIATTFGAGFSPFAPGTAGAIVGCAFLWGFNELQYFPTFPNPFLFVVLILVVALLGIYATNKLEQEWGKDPSKVVIDELVGVWVAMVFVPFTWLNLLLAFGLFRFFDIAKPLGVRKMEQLKGGLGVMADDVLAGIYANLVLQLILIFI
ncbi:MAG: phosphatidylglycerophosphatase A [Flavobacteriales bacterium]|jgi:phosphatidylglycerophosphatase A|nr:phosphatidylglycerophosphatase A [Flavobacteriales bacterium]MCW8913267.1 phosphatidylglycerophosphatase A [Flavobacteriales bacterium]MCW8938953.1 phosphatidylglycerophosphatase A [Flavobacteriales bacterium]MCW8939416.1 phosphatidylglycerophosphatase A [Flavobacteriales bacterium]MCW8968205.1 phosphatidylglycerophosphatase A [Flavobacteriales bacterium]